MCGILGEIRRSGSVNEPAFRRMLDRLAHRGPDGSGVRLLEQGRVALGHRRLSIIDLSDAGAQPMANEDGSVWVVFNGEIYNFRDLRRELEACGHLFRSTADTEVIVHGYEEWGDGCVERLAGMFAFGLWDCRAQRLLLARDRVGIKPLYIFDDGRRLIFASELKALLADPDMPRTVDLAAFSDYMAYGYVPFDRCIFKGIRKLPPAHRMICDGSDVRRDEYWTLNYSPDIAGLDEAAAAVRGAMGEAVSAHMVSDVPIGVFLSGGVDSSGVAALMKEAGASPLRAFTIGFDDPRLDETANAGLMARHLGAEFHVDRMACESARSLLKSYQEAYDEPFLDASGLPTYLVSRFARTMVKVVLSGDGGDEIFAGYEWYDWFIESVGTRPRNPAVRALSRTAEALLSPLNARSWRARALTQRCAKIGRDPVDRFFDIHGVTSRDDQRGILSDTAAEAVAEDTAWLFRRYFRDDWPRVTAAQFMDLKTFLADKVLVKVDRASMANSLEVRVPLLDHRLVELAFRIRSDCCYRYRQKKIVSRRALEPLLPPEILHGAKKGFDVPMDQWLAEGLFDQPAAYLRDGSLAARGFLNPDRIEGWLAAPGADSRRLWLVLAAELWARRWLEAE